jgi:hypothetical protein
MLIGIHILRSFRWLDLGVSTSSRHAGVHDAIIIITTLGHRFGHLRYT